MGPLTVLHPFLSLHGQGDTEMSVSGDPKYEKLIEVFEPDEAKRVMEFVNTAVARNAHSSSLFLAPDASRQHRTQVRYLPWDMSSLSPIPPSHLGPSCA
jgi:hypothetical protein